MSASPSGCVDTPLYSADGNTVRHEQRGVKGHQQRKDVTTHHAPIPIDPFLHSSSGMATRSNVHDPSLQTKVSKDHSKPPSTHQHQQPYPLVEPGVVTPVHNSFLELQHFEWRMAQGGGGVEQSPGGTQNEQPDQEQEGAHQRYTSPQPSIFASQNYSSNFGEQQLDYDHTSNKKKFVSLEERGGLFPATSTPPSNKRNDMSGGPPQHMSSSSAQKNNEASILSTSSADGHTIHEMLLSNRSTSTPQSNRSGGGRGVSVSPPPTPPPSSSLSATVYAVAKTKLKVATTTTTTTPGRRKNNNNVHGNSPPEDNEDPSLLMGEGKGAFFSSSSTQPLPLAIPSSTNLLSSLSLFASRAYRCFDKRDVHNVLQYGLFPDLAPLGPRYSLLPTESLLDAWHEAYRLVMPPSSSSSSKSWRRGGKHKNNAKKKSPQPSSVGGGGKQEGYHSASSSSSSSSLGSEEVEGSAMMRTSTSLPANVPPFGAGSPTCGISVFLSLERALELGPHMKKKKQQGSQKKKQERKKKREMVVVIFDICSKTLCRLTHANSFSTLDAGIDAAVSPDASDLLLRETAQVFPRYVVLLED